MPFPVTIEDQTARLRADLRMGLPVVVTENGGKWLACAVETLNSERLTGLRGFGAVEIGVTKWRAETLSAPAYDGDLVRIVMPKDAELRWLHAMADPSLDLSVPMKGPFKYIRDGAPDAHRAIIALCKRAGLLPCVALVHVAIDTDVSGLSAISLADLQVADDTHVPLELIANARVPLHVAQLGRVHVFRKRDGGEEHYAVEIGKPARAEPVLSRLHSACFTGDLMGSLKCDCGAQLQSALHLIGGEGAGVLLYLNQEGRGIGLANKMRAYALQDQGFDTVEANHRLGFEDDERDFRLGAEILSLMGFKSVRLITNNPLKIAKMEQAGIAVSERVPIKVGRTDQNTDYLDTKASKSGHLL